MKTSSQNLVLLALCAVATGVGCGVSGSSPTGGATPGSAGLGSPGAAGSTQSAGASGGPGAAGSGTGAAGSGSSSPGAAGTSDPGTAGTGSSGAAGTSGGAGSTGAAGVTGAAGGGTTGAAGTAPLSGITIKIGGTDVPKENAIAFLHFGHSNMAGRGVDPAATRPFFFDAAGDPHAWMYHSGVGFERAVEPKTAGDGANVLNGMVSGGPGTALVKEAAALAPNQYFISLGFGQNSAYCSQFLPGALYYTKVMAGALELKGKVTFAGIMIYLGITERHGTQADINNYPQCINQLVTQVRKDLGEPNLPLMINDYEMGTTGPLAPGSAFYNAILPKIRMVPMVVSSSILIPTDNITIQDDHQTSDDHHFDLDGHKEYVRRMLAAMQQKGWFPWH